jgi:hypothetical protein
MVALLPSYEAKLIPINHIQTPFGKKGEIEEF